jgi:hypothetical protein
VNTTATELTTPPDPRISLFRGYSERVNLLMPMLFVLLAIAEFKVGLPREVFRWNRFLSETLGLNLIHNAFSLGILLLPEFRDWLRTKSLATKSFDSARNWILSVLVIILVVQAKRWFQLERFGPFAASLQNGYPEVMSLGNFASLGFKFGLLYIVLAHATWQTYGLSLVYNREAKAHLPLTAEELEKFKTVEWWERLFSRIHSYLVPIIVVFYAEILVSSWRWPTVAATSALVAIQIYLCRLYPLAHRSNKTFYQLRLVLWPLALVSPMALMGIACTHGTEYWCVFEKMVRRSRIERPSFSVWMPTLYLSLLVGFLGVFKDYNSGGLPNLAHLWPTLPRDVRLVLASFSGTITLVHYFIDSRIFRFSDLNTRKFIGPLLLQSEK